MRVSRDMRGACVQGHACVLDMRVCPVTCVVVHGDRGDTAFWVRGTFSRRVPPQLVSDLVTSPPARACHMYRSQASRHALGACLRYACDLWL